MTNPFEFFNASDDEDEPKTTHVKKEEKHSLSNSCINQLTQRSEPTRSSKRKMPRKLLRSPKAQEDPQLKRLSLNELRIILIEVTTCLVISKKSFKKRYGVKRTHKVIISIADQELAESKNIFIQRTTKKGWRWIRKCWKHQGLT